MWVQWILTFSKFTLTLPFFPHEVWITFVYPRVRSLIGIRMWPDRQLQNLLTAGLFITLSWKKDEQRDENWWPAWAENERGWLATHTQWAMIYCTKTTCGTVCSVQTTAVQVHPHTADQQHVWQMSNDEADMLACCGDKWTLAGR